MPPTISSVYRTNIARTMAVEFVLEHVCPAPCESLSGALDVRVVLVRLSR
jgi:hypothetical protein